MTAMQTWTLPNVTLITPMLGGGVTPMEPDLDCPVRPSEIRGQLRYWWRAVQTVETVDDLRRAEARVWGATDRRSAVTVRVCDMTTPETEWATNTKEETKAKAPARRGDPAHDLGYVYFPSRPTLQNGWARRKMILPGLHFTLRVTCPEAHAEEVTRSIALWALFGGLGARTRRGSGAVALDFGRLGLDLTSLPKLEAWLDGLPRPSSPRPWPTLGGRVRRRVLLSAGSSQDAEGAWGLWMRRYKGFRQQRGGPCPGRSDPRIKVGRSHWPEPDAVRRITGSALDEPKHSHAPTHPDGVFFPRGAYGLPIVFHFKDGPEERKVARSAKLDPPDHHLVIDETHDRWASPVILRVARLPGGEVVKICWVLESPLPDRFHLKGPDGRSLTALESPRAFFDGSGKSVTVGSSTLLDPYESLCAWMVQGAQGAPPPALVPGERAGIVKFFQEAKGFGFIEVDGGGQDVFVHVSGLERPLQALQKGQRVAFRTGRGRKGPEAKEVRLL